MAANSMRLSTLIRLVLLAAVVSSASGQFHLGPKPRQPSPTPPPMRKASTFIQRQAPLKVNQSLLKQATQDNTRIVVSIPKQRAYLMIGDQVVADGPVSSGRRGHETPRGHFNVMEKDPNHHSSLYGDFVDSSGRTVRGGGQCAQRFRAERNALCRRGHEMVPSPDRRRRRDAHRNFAWLPRLAWLHPPIRRWRKIVLRLREGRNVSRCW